MADQSDVENSLVTLVANGLYPNGSVATSISGAEYHIYRGWPNSGALDADLAAGRINVTVFPSGEAGCNTTRYPPRWMVSRATPTLVAAVSDISVTFDGSATLGQVAGVLINDMPYVYRTQEGDTPDTVAANLAAAMRANWIVNLAGACITIPGAFRLIARTVADASATSEVRRQKQSFRITCWCPDPTTRDITAIAIDQSLATVTFIELADSTLARLRCQGTLEFDQSQDALLYRRDLLYDVEYATTITVSQPAMLFGELTLNATTTVV